LGTWDPNPRLGSFDRFFEGDLQIVAEICPASDRAPRPPPAEYVAEAEKILENASAENVRELAKDILIDRGASFETGAAVLVVGGSFFGISEDAVGFRGFLERILGGLVAGILVWVKLDGEPSVRALDLLLTCCLTDA
jgi:hypothetical protein